MRKPSRIVKAPARPALPLDRCLAKTRLEDFDGHKRRQPGRTVEDHCRIAGAVAKELLQRLPPCLRPLFPEGSHIPALVHDVGKILPDFLRRLYENLGWSTEDVPELKGVDRKQHCDHAAVSLAALLSWARTLTGKTSPGVEEVAKIVGQHHGFDSDLNNSTGDSEIYGGKVWQARREELLRRLLGENPVWPRLESEATQRLVAGLTVVADWIGSGPLFDDPGQDWSPLVTQAVDEAGFKPPILHPGLSFEDIFGFDPRPAQKALYEAVQGPGLYILEAPMGLGKTEAALYAAYRLMAEGQSSGLYFALPTQLTSNRLHARVDAFLERVLVSEEKARLAHGKAWLHDFLERQRLGAGADPSGAWFAQPRRSLLAPFAVGTVDQALMAAIHVRHSPLRSFALAGKCIVLDEVHSYDAYTGTLIDLLVEQLKDLRATIIILSATLTARRRSLLTGLDSERQDYPLITACPRQQPGTEVSVPGSEEKRVDLIHADEAEAVEEALRRAEEGQRVLWIENTVNDAQERYRLLRGRAAGMDRLPVGLLHSRFTPRDRQINEDRWTTLYAPGAAARGQEGCLLVGTQVLEQSLDLDADFLVSRFCPTDMLLQRLGRLWRHETTLRPATARREAWLLHPDPDEASHDPKEAFGLTGSVYAPYVLCRSLEVWKNLRSVSLPGAVRDLLERTYAERTEDNPVLRAALEEVEKERLKLHNQALRAASSNTGTLPDKDAGTRANEIPQADVLLLREWKPAEGWLVTASDERLDIAQAVSWEERSRIRAVLALNTVRVPEGKAPPAGSPAELRWLSDCLHVVDRSDRPLLRLALVGPDGRLRHPDGNLIASGALRYGQEYGYTSLKNH